MIKIILGALNEAQNLKILLPEICDQMQKLKLDFEIILCIDASSDDSQEIILAQKNTYPIRILDFCKEKGLGKAIKRLFLDVINNSQDEDVIISMDADNTHFPRQIEEIIDYFKQNSQTEVLILSRFCNNSKIIDFPFRRILISKTTSFLLQIVFGIKRVSGGKIKDYSSGYRAYKAYKVKELYQKLGDDFIRQNDFTHTCELLINFDKINAKFDEIGLYYDYGKKIGASKLRFFENARSLLKLMAKKMFSRLGFFTKTAIF